MCSFPPGILAPIELISEREARGPVAEPPSEEGVPGRRWGPSPGDRSPAAAPARASKLIRRSLVGYRSDPYSSANGWPTVRAEVAEAPSRGDGRGEPAASCAGSRPAQCTWDRGHHRRGNLRVDGRGGSPHRGTGADALVRLRRRHLHLCGSVLCRVRVDGSGCGLGLHLCIRDAGRTLRLDHRLGLDPRIRGGVRRPSRMGGRDTSSAPAENRRSTSPMRSAGRPSSTTRSLRPTSRLAASSTCLRSSSS